jgi:hypothetical protein
MVRGRGGGGAVGTVERVGTVGTEGRLMTRFSDILSDL